MPQAGPHLSLTPRSGRCPARFGLLLQEVPSRAASGPTIRSLAGETRWPSPACRTRAPSSASPLERCTLARSGAMGRSCAGASGPTEKLKRPRESFEQFPLETTRPAPFEPMVPSLVGARDPILPHPPARSNRSASVEIQEATSGTPARFATTVAPSVGASAHRMLGPSRAGSCPCPPALTKSAQSTWTALFPAVLALSDRRRVSGRGRGKLRSNASRGSGVLTSSWRTRRTARP